MEDRQISKEMWPSAGRTIPKLILTCLAASSIFPTLSASRFEDWLGRANQIPFISLPSSVNHDAPRPSKSPGREHEFQLQHIFHHGTYRHPNLHVRMDVKPGVTLRALDENGQEQSLPSVFRARSQETMIERLSDRSVPTMQSLYHNVRLSGLAATLDDSAWSLDEVTGPNTTDKETVVNLAKMSWCAYVKEPGTGDWQDIGGGFNESQGLGWEGDSLRGHIFADKDNSTIVLALKGTSPGECSRALSRLASVHPEKHALNSPG